MNNSLVNVAPYVPAMAKNMVAAMLQNEPVHISVVPPRKSLLGSYSPAIHARPHTITVNANLNPYQFLMVLLHEWAHYVQWQQYHSKGHGKEWKLCFAQLLVQYVHGNVFPPDLARAVTNYAAHVKSTECADMEMCRLFQKYDNMYQKQQNSFFLADIPEKTVFLHNEIPMQKQQTLRKYVVCKNLKNNKLYRCRPSMKVTVCSEENIKSIKN